MRLLNAIEHKFLFNKLCGE